MTDQARDEFLEQNNVSRETLERLDCYAGLLRKWNPAINLVSKSTIDAAWGRHFHDSAQVFDLASSDVESWVDFGSGGGFPGLIVAILAKEASPQLKVTLVESDVRKAAFLSTVARETGVNVAILAERVENIEPLKADIVSARALAPLAVLLSFAERHLRCGGTALFQKGAMYEAELRAASEVWNFKCDAHASTTDANAVILEIGDIARV
ncbi:16S rRNA (guanine(527)-N(7))-methyltransferase RsmG [Pseudogemmobacter sp. W21_MBD1_M6]|uniref:16S rRNA (guanine(527)-N(7))-methyltransferase RsmG n=1 Tax=Pseudogemmobacter sp. W21_MBD1_M6 TaxID=3240271 RepID=UPI003F99FA08